MADNQDLLDVLTLSRCQAAHNYFGNDAHYEDIETIKGRPSSDPNGLVSG